MAERMDGSLAAVRKKNLEEKARHSADGFPMKLYYNDFAQYVAHQIPWHWHVELEFGVVLEGEVELSVGADTLHLGPGEAVFINSNLLHRMVPAGPAPAYMFSIVTNSAMLAIDPAFLMGAKYVTPYINDETMRYAHLYPDGGWRSDVIERLLAVYDCYENEKWFEYRTHNLLCEIWLLLLEYCWKEEPGRRKREHGDERVRIALEFIHSHYTRELSLEDICSAAHISKTECCRCFQKTLRMTPFEYLSFYRVSLAAQRLRQTSDTITEIALETGFHSNSYFGKVFHKYIGCTPLQYRRKGIASYQDPPE